MVEQGFLRGDDVADCDVRKIRAIGFAGLRVDIAGIGRAEGRASMFEATMNNLSVSIALPGPIRPSHEPGWLAFAGLRPAKWWLPV
jgi:hypothetical protein